MPRILLSFYEITPKLVVSQRAYRGIRHKKVSMEFSGSFELLGLANTPKST